MLGTVYSLRIPTHITRSLPGPASDNGMRAHRRDDFGSCVSNAAIRSSNHDNAIPQVHGRVGKLCSHYPTSLNQVQQSCGCGNSLWLVPPRNAISNVSKYGYRPKMNIV